MLDLPTAKMILQETFDSAFTKTAGTKKQRVSMANICIRKVPCTNNMALMLWATDYCANWKKA